ncbi:hypothetical protein L202_07212 [Cryptococcus amylolentus CBS 6039]|uniref:Uncharacterized protein n=1 Tax=Cryptococcus amylolentus CBS 6039 TaxID=1295533 RepID=A0A1E3HC06_9TREE|nr:hypothetical protein L202_07212 [Cryptococcus amylolentus CBS 6039]ODN73665.1 hypothetical protein L202_07212 [Cryptococcus amylolentus CBS 6039]
MLFTTYVLLSLIGLTSTLASPGPLAARQDDDPASHPPSAQVIKPKDQDMESFKAAYAQFFVSPELIIDIQRLSFEDLCPRFYEDSEETDKPIWVRTEFSADSLSSAKKRYDPEDVATDYELPTAEYRNVGIDVAIALGGDGISTINE